MTYTSLSTKYQVVIPKEVRSRLEMKPGQKFVIWEKDGVIYLIPTEKIKDLQGFLKGMDASQFREETDRL
ncbi:MAG: AbrB/MazE/SpoVT family DNA-binding domain-containing protein [Deltaproteobacteria bacterium]|nr:AbrB/MazE/SpoVT family DNA-binding domain-containing protein [Deltaproteobacteria bacterium]